MVIRALFSILAVGIALFQPRAQSGAAAPASPPDKYVKWLNEEVPYIITPSEREVFLKLKTDRERDFFLEAFWKHRNPTPGAVENSFQTEHYRRLNYANAYFGRSSTRPGWQTDRGRIYILLGEPRSIGRYIGEPEIYNTEVWFYQDLAAIGLPPGFNLIFFQKGGTGDYVLYSPIHDGPQALLSAYLGDQTNALRAYRQLRQLQPNLANTAISLIPGEASPYSQPSLTSEILLQNISNVPRRLVHDAYAEKFLLFKDIVEVDYSANYVDSDSLVAVLADPSGLHFVNYLLELKKLSLALDRGTASTRLILNGNVTDSQGRSIFQFENAIPLELTEDELKNVTYNPFDIQEMFPLIPGRYRLSILLKNEVSKEFTSMERAIVVPEAGSAPGIGPLLLGFRATSDIPGTEKAARLAPFKFGTRRVYCQPRAMFLATETMFLAFQALGLDPGAGQRARLKYEILKEEETVFSFEKSLSGYPDALAIVEEFPMAKYPPADYRIRVSLMDGPRVLGSGEERFAVTPVASFPRPWNHSRSSAPSQEFIYPIILGAQYLNAGEKAKAGAQFEKAYQNPPAAFPYVMNLARGFFELGDFPKTVKLLTPLSEGTGERYEVLFMLGRSHQALGDCRPALASYEKALSHFGANVPLLNSLGECHLELGQKEAAVSAWSKSLELNPQQPELEARLEALKNRDRREPLPSPTGNLG